MFRENQWHGTNERTDRQMDRQTNRVQQLMRLPRAGRTFYHVPTYSERKVCDRQTDRQTDRQINITKKRNIFVDEMYSKIRIE